MATTTVRVLEATRDELSALAAEGETTVEGVIRGALARYRHERWRTRAAAEERVAAAGAADRAELTSVLVDLG